MVVTSVIVVASLTALLTETLRASLVTASVGLTLIAAAEALILLLGIGQMDCLILITAASSCRAFVTVITPRFTVSAVIVTSLLAILSATIIVASLVTVLSATIIIAFLVRVHDGCCRVCCHASRFLPPDDPRCPASP